MLGGLNKVAQQIECLNCPWNKNCIEPPTMTTEEVKAKIDEFKPDSKTSEAEVEKSAMGSLMSVMFFGGKDTECRVCPIFAAKLRENPELSQQIKEIMKSK